MVFTGTVRRIAAFIVLLLLAAPAAAGAQQAIRSAFATTTASSTASTTDLATTTAGTAGQTLFEALTAPKQDLTRPEDQPQKDEIQQLLEQRPAKSPSVLGFFAYWVQKAIAFGIPANTITLILLIPVLATLVAFTRVILGLPSLEMLVPIVLAFALASTGITAGLIVLGAVVLASFVSRTILRRVPIMHFPKRSISHLFLAFFVFGALTVAIILNIEPVRNLSIFPLLILTLLGDSIVSVQLHKTLRETTLITSVTIALGLAGYLLATSMAVRDTLILWPEVVLLTVPVNLLLGRYFGLRLSEVLRFKTLERYGSE